MFAATAAFVVSVFSTLLFFNDRHSIFQGFLQDLFDGLNSWSPGPLHLVRSTPVVP